MVSVWYVLWVFCAGCLIGFLLHGCIDWKNDNWGNEYRKKKQGRVEEGKR